MDIKVGHAEHKVSDITECDFFIQKTDLKYFVALKK